MTLQEAAEALTTFRVLGGMNTKTPIRTHIASWSSHYQTWKEFKSQRKYLLVKYEDLISDKKNTFLKILEFICKLNKTKLTVDENKLKNVIETTVLKICNLWKKNLVLQSQYLIKKAIQLNSSI